MMLTSAPEPALQLQVQSANSAMLNEARVVVLEFVLGCSALGEPFKDFVKDSCQTHQSSPFNNRERPGWTQDIELFGQTQEKSPETMVRVKREMDLLLAGLKDADNYLLVVQGC